MPKSRDEAWSGPRARDLSAFGACVGGWIARTNEGVCPSTTRELRIRDYQPWQGSQSGPKGTITDDTQMSMWLAESILARSQRTALLTTLTSNDSKRRAIAWSIAQVLGWSIDGDLRRLELNDESQWAGEHRVAGRWQQATQYGMTTKSRGTTPGSREV